MKVKTVDSYVVNAPQLTACVLECQNYVVKLIFSAHFPVLESVLFFSTDCKDEAEEVEIALLRD